MRGAPSKPHQALFALSATALVVAAIIFSGAGDSGSARETPALARARMSPGPPATPGQHAELRVAARTFLDRFFRYEVGSLASNEVGGLRRTAISAFASELLRKPPRMVGQVPTPAQLERLSLEFLNASPSRARVSGFALRGRARERFSFLFEEVEGVWRASGPAS